MCLSPDHGRPRGQVGEKATKRQTGSARVSLQIPGRPRDWWLSAARSRLRDPAATARFGKERSDPPRPASRALHCTPPNAEIAYAPTPSPFGLPGSNRLTEQPFAKRPAPATTPSPTYVSTQLIRRDCGVRTALQVAPASDERRMIVGPPASDDVGSRRRVRSSPIAIASPGRVESNATDWISRRHSRGPNLHDRPDVVDRARRPSHRISSTRDPMETPRLVQCFARTAPTRSQFAPASSERQMAVGEDDGRPTPQTREATAGSALKIPSLGGTGDHEAPPSAERNARKPSPTITTFPSAVSAIELAKGRPGTGRGADHVSPPSALLIMCALPVSSATTRSSSCSATEMANAWPPVVWPTAAAGIVAATTHAAVKHRLAVAPKGPPSSEASSINRPLPPEWSPLSGEATPSWTGEAIQLHDNTQDDHRLQPHGRGASELTAPVVAPPPENSPVSPGLPTSTSR